MQYYANTEEPYCVCCYENIYEFLALDHINGGGGAERKKLGGGGYWIYLDKYHPDGYQILCHNCNMGRQINNGICPHLNV